MYNVLLRAVSPHMQLSRSQFPVQPLCSCVQLACEELGWVITAAFPAARDHPWITCGAYKRERLDVLL